MKAHTTSPEVISSLIDSLSAISLSTHDHFESLPAASASHPPSPNTQVQFDGDTLVVGSGNTPDGSAYYQTLQGESYLYPDDACEPPVIRTSKPPSGLSPITAPKRKERENSLKSYLSRGAGSSASIHSAYSARSGSSFGAISIETGIPRRASSASNRTSTESKGSIRGHRSLMYMSSREQLRVKDAERKRASIQGPELSGSLEIAKRASLQLSVSEDTIREEPVVAESSRAAQKKPARGISPLRNGFNLLMGDSASSSEKHLIPERGSSLRHSESPSRKGRKSRKNGRHDSYKTNTVPEEDENVDQESLVKEKILKELEAEENEVAQRIRELKAQKMLRDQLASEVPVGVDAVASTSGTHVSPVEFTQLSLTSTVSSVSQKRVQDPAKAHKILGIAMQSSTPPESRGSRDTESLDLRATPKPNGHTRTRSMTVNDSDDITPLPINYHLALQTLDLATSAPSLPPPPSSSASSRETISSNTPRSRSVSAVVGGRSAVSRKSRNSSIMGVSTAPSPPTGVTSGAHHSMRSASDEIETGLPSLTVNSSPPASSSQQRPTQKKKRWSHPDLPAKAEKRHNDKVEAINASVQKNPHPAIEERPLSADSIDMDVEAYLNSPRLSQKLRHPQTGRIISFSEVGDPQGFAIFVCVGMGLTKFVMAFYDQLALSLKLRLITPERPGIGDSQVDPNGTPLSWPGTFIPTITIHI
jgi:hypothetical protein